MRARACPAAPDGVGMGARAQGPGIEREAWTVDDAAATDGLQVDAILSRIRAWVEIETPTGHIDGINALMDHASAEYEAIGGVLERIPGRDGQGDHVSIRLPWTGRADPDAPGILVLSHLDTVHPVGTIAEALPFRVEDGRAWGPGIADMKGGAAMALAALEALHRAGADTPLPVRVLLTSDEEIGSPTSEGLIRAAAREAAYVLCTEPARNGGKAVTARKGVGRYGLEAKGRAAHSGGNHQDGRSAIAELARKVVEIEERTDYARGMTFNVGRIWGGTTDNTVPERAGCRIDLRVETEEDAAEADAWLRSLRPENPDVTLTLEGGLNRPPFAKSNAIAALFEHARGLAEEIGFSLEDMASGGGSDASFVARDTAVLDGIGIEGALMHTHGEHVMVDSIVPRTRLFMRLFETLR
ncbi:MAG: M20 family metallopeptidase [Pseudomonadota bacterium]